jgi:hypothetical protein
MDTIPNSVSQGSSELNQYGSGHRGRGWIQHLFLERQMVKWEGSQGNSTDSGYYGPQENLQQTQSQ